ncbi:MAG TPA: type 1 glutamine amidotransferase [Mycobacteriales bacterium]|nr:type 1 glutamine amidotransferase [Mycobacteriales bacterium]
MIQHTPGEEPGWLADWLPARGLTLDVAHPYRDGVVPPLADAAALIVLGGPMGAYDDEAAPWLSEVRSRMREAVTAGLPTLGICLGAQLLAVALGGVVERGAAGPELGLGEVDVPDGDALLPAGVLPVVQWHYDTVTELPTDAVLLASSVAYPVQAFRIGECAWGLQFHVEAGPEMVKAWAAEDGVDGVADPVAAAAGRLAAAGEQIAHRFADLVSCQRLRGS